jgi:hypothetical protein
MARLSKAVLASGKVVPLPGAATRQVDNSRYADQRRASRAARQETPFADRYKPWYDREADQLAADLSDIRQTPELLILSAMLRTMEAEAVTKVLEQLAPGAVTGSEPHRQAVTTIKASRLNLGQQFDLSRAFDRLRGEGR